MKRYITNQTPDKVELGHIHHTFFIKMKICDILSLKIYNSRSQYKIVCREIQIYTWGV